MPSRRSGVERNREQRFASLPELYRLSGPVPDRRAIAEGLAAKNAEAGLAPVVRIEGPSRSARP